MEKIIPQLQGYTSGYPEEMESKKLFLEFLNHHDNCFERSLKTGHITGSAWIMDQSMEYALLTHHMKLNKWLQLGGHADGDTDVARVAHREAMEESGLASVKLLNTNIFDIDIHTIPERGDESEHLHYDIRYLFKANKTKSLQHNHESKALKWVKLSEISSLVNNNVSIMRMVEKSTLQFSKFEINM